MKPAIPQPCICLVTDRRLCGSEPRALVDKVARALRGGVNMVQLREKDLPGGELLALARRLRQVTEGSALLFVNERVDVALACGADGVQLGEEGLPVEVARQLAGEGLLLGRSVHSLEGALAAEDQGCDFLVVGPVFSTASHPGEAPMGPPLLSAVAERVALPLVGIGGITEANVDQVTGAGATGAAGIRAVLGAQDPEMATRKLREALDASHARTRAPRKDPKEAPVSVSPAGGGSPQRDR